MLLQLVYKKSTQIAAKSQKLYINVQPSIGADFAGATGASAPAQFLQRRLSPLTYDAARDGRGGKEGRGREGRRRGGTFSPRTLESKSAPMQPSYMYTGVYNMLNCIMCYTGISAAAGIAADGMKAAAAPSKLRKPSTGVVCAGQRRALQRRPTADLHIGAYSSRRLVCVVYHGSSL
jgi:hypothetical protein